MSWFNSKKEEVPEVTSKELYKHVYLDIYCIDGTKVSTWIYNWDQIKDKYEDDVTILYKDFLDWWYKKKTKSYLIKGNTEGKTDKAIMVLRSNIKSFMIEVR